MVAFATPAAAAAPTCTNTTVTCVTGTAPDGSTYKAEVPSAWNGTLLIYSHGYRPPIGPNPPADTWRSRAATDDLLARGYALAGSSYASNGWAVEDAFRDQIDILDRFEHPRGPPRPRPLAAPRGTAVRALRASAVPAAVRPRVAEVERPTGLRRGPQPPMRISFLLTNSSMP